MIQTPSLASLIYRAKSTLEKQLGVGNPAVDAIASTIAGANYGQYAYQDYLFKQLNPETAEEQWLYLWANRFNVERLTFVFATGTVNFQLTSGVVNIPTGVILKTSDNREYQTTQAIDSDQEVPVEAIEAGDAGNLTAGVNLYLVTAVTGLNPDTISSNEIAGGADLEELEHWRERIITAYNDDQIIGKLEDYEYWAVSAHQDVDFAWGLDNTPVLGNVTVYFAQAENNPLLSDEIKTIVQQNLDDNRLAGCHLFAKHPEPKAVSISISDVSDIDMRTSIASLLQSFFNERLDDRSELRSNELSAQIMTVTNEFTLVSPVATTPLADNELYTLGEISFL